MQLLSFWLKQAYSSAFLRRTGSERTISLGTWRNMKCFIHLNSSCDIIWLNFYSKNGFADLFQVLRCLFLPELINVNAIHVCKLFYRKITNYDIIWFAQIKPIPNFQLAIKAPQKQTMYRQIQMENICLSIMISFLVITMVKGFDTTKTDPSKIFLDYLFSYFGTNKETLSCEKASQLIKQWIRNSTSTLWVYQQFDKLSTKPKIIIEKRCPSHFFSKVPVSGDKHFPGYQKDGEIHICLNNIRNKIQLKQNLDRELYVSYYSQILKQTNPTLQQKEADRNLMQSLYQSCQKGYQSYGWEEKTFRRISQKCAVYLFRRRSHSNLPPDSLFRYASKLGQQVCI